MYVSLYGAIGGVALGAFIIWLLDVAFPVSAFCSLVALWMATGDARSTMWHTPQRAFANALGVAGTSVFVAASIWVFHVDRLWVDSGTAGVECGGPLPLGAIAAVSALLLGPMLAERFARAYERPLRFALRPLLVLLAIVVVRLAVLGLVRGASLPTTQHPFEHLPVVGEYRVTDEGAQSVAGASLSFQCVAMDRGESARNCSAWMHPVSGVPRRATSDDSFPTVVLGSSVRVLRDRRRDLWIVRAPMLHGPPQPIAAFRGPTFTRVDLSLSDFPGDFAPPRGWPIAALFGVALAAWFVFRARLVERQPTGPLVDAKLTADRTLHLADGTSFAAAPDTALPACSVVIAAPTAAPYRDRAPLPVLRAGTLGQWNDALREERDVRHALAFSTLALLGTPLVMAACMRLLW